MQSEMMAGGLATVAIVEAVIERAACMSLAAAFIR